MKKRFLGSVAILAAAVASGAQANVPGSGDSLTNTQAMDADKTFIFIEQPFVLENSKSNMMLAAHYSHRSHSSHSSHRSHSSHSSHYSGY